MKTTPASWRRPYMHVAVALVLALGRSSRGQIQSAERQELPDGGASGRPTAVVELDLPVRSRDAFEVQIQIDGALRTLHLRQHSVRARDFRVLADGGGGELREVPAPPVLTYRGYVVGMPESVVIGGLNGGLRALIALDEAGAANPWIIEPQPGNDGTGRWHTLSRVSDLPPIEGRCGVPPSLMKQIAQEGGGVGVAGGADLVIQLAYDADFEFYQFHNASVALTVADIENLTNWVNWIYERDVDITFVISEIILRTTEDDPYFGTDAVCLLDQMVCEWLSNQGEVDYHVAHLLTGRTLDEGIVGQARNSEVCADRTCGTMCSDMSIGPYGLSATLFAGGQFFHRVALIAHEIGHNFNANHCDDVYPCNIMCARLGGCEEIGLPNFAPTSIASIVGYKATLQCIDGAQCPAGGPPAPQTYEVAGDANGTPWSWCVRFVGSALPDLCDMMVEGVAAGGAAIDVAQAFADSINAARDARGCTMNQLNAIAQQIGSTAYLSIAVSAGVPIELSVGAAGTNPDCPVDFLLPACSFNPTIEWLPIPSDDCNCNFIADLLDIGSGHSQDVNRNGIPDECECPGDLDGSGHVDAADLAILLGAWGPAGSCAADLDIDGDVDAGDLAILLGAWGDCFGPS